MAATFIAGIDDDLPRPTAGGASGLDAKNPRGLNHLAVSIAASARFSGRPGFTASSAATSAAFTALKLDAARHATCGFGKRQHDFNLNIGPTLLPSSSTPTATTAEEVSEDAATEDISKGFKDIFDVAKSGTRCPGHACVTVLVIASPLLGIA
jgi:hypothetical protein